MAAIGGIDRRTIMRKSLLTIFICLISAMLLSGCGKSDDSSLTDKFENIMEDAEENENEEENATTFDVKQAEKNLKEMSDAMVSYLWVALMTESEGDVFNLGEGVDLKLSDSDKIRAAVLASETDGVIDSYFTLKKGELVEDKNAETGPDSDGFHGMSVPDKSVEENYMDLFGEEADWDALPTEPECDLLDAVSYTDEDGTYALQIDQEVDTETALQNHECKVKENVGKYIGEVNIFWGYWGELEQKPGYSNYIVSYSLELNDKSKYGMAITAISVRKAEVASKEDVTITDVSWNFGSYEEWSENNSDVGEVYFKLSNGDTTTEQVPLGYYVEGMEELDIDGDGEDEIVINQYFFNTIGEFNIIYIFKLADGNIEDISPMGDVPELTDDVADMMIKPLDKEGYPKYALDVTTYQKESADVSVKYHTLLAWHNGSWEEIETNEPDEKQFEETSEDHTIPEYFIYVISPDGYANLRTGPGAEYDVICQIPTGDSMEVYRETATDKKGNKWLKVAYWHPEGTSQLDGSNEQGITEIGWIAESQVE